MEKGTGLKDTEIINNIIVNSTGLIDLTNQSINKFNENSISSFEGLSTIKPPGQISQPIIVHQPIFGDTSKITLSREEFINILGREVTDEVLGNKLSFTFAANSELLYIPPIEDDLSDEHESDDDVFLRGLVKMGKLSIIKHQ